MGRYQSTPNTAPQGDWPQVFDKPMIGLDLNGIIVQDKPLRSIENVEVIPGVLDAIKLMRLKRHRVFILSDQPLISKGVITQENIDTCFQHLMNIFGQAGIMSIDGFLYNTSDNKDDVFAKPNVGMVKRAEQEILRNSCKFKDGYYCGDSLIDLKFADKIGCTPVLIRTGNYESATSVLDKFTYKDIKQKTKIFNTLLEFANSLP